MRDLGDVRSSVRRTARRMGNRRRGTLLVLGAGLVGAGLVSVADAAPGPNANCNATKTCAPTTTAQPTTTTTPASTTTAATTTTTGATTTTTAATTTTTTTGATTTTTVGPTTTTITAAPGSCVNLTPISNLQAAFDAYGPGTSFCFAAGTYVLTGYITPRANDRLISTTPRGAILTGNGIYNAGISPGPGWPVLPVTGVTVSGFKIQNMANQFVTWPRSAILAGPDWTIENNEVSNNTQAGVQVATGNILRNNWLHHNGRYGFMGGEVDGVLIENNEVSFNNTAQNPINSDGGGSKIGRGTNVVFRGNNVHDNYGNGLWCDWECRYITYENNTLTNNWYTGILHEASADAVIRNNTFSRNSKVSAGKSLWWGADLFIYDSKNTEIYGNTVTAGVHGIGLVDIDRGSNAFGLMEIRNVYVHDNIVKLPTGGVSGLIGNRSTAYQTSTANRFVNNTYYVTSTAAASWQWNTQQTWTQWHALGMDTTGSLFTWAG